MVRRVKDQSSDHAMSSYPSTLCFLGGGVGAADCVVLVVVWVRRCERGRVWRCLWWALGAGSAGWWFLSGVWRGQWYLWGKGGGP